MKKRAKKQKPRVWLPKEILNFSAGSRRVWGATPLEAKWEATTFIMSIRPGLSNLALMLPILKISLWMIILQLLRFKSKSLKISKKTRKRRWNSRCNLIFIQNPAKTPITPMILAATPAAQKAATKHIAALIQTSSPPARPKPKS